MGRQGKLTGAEEKRVAGKRGGWEEGPGVEKQKVRSRGVLMAVCREGLGHARGCGGRGIGVCVCGWREVWM